MRRIAWMGMALAVMGAGLSQAQEANPASAAPSAKRTIVVPAGTKILLQLKSAVNTKTAQAGDGVYLTSIFPVAAGNRVAIPAGVFVQGVVDRVQRAGRMKGKAQLDMHFTSILFPNGSVVEIPGSVDALPGAQKQSVQNGEGTIEQASDKTREMGSVAKVSVPTGAGVGAAAGMGVGHPLEGGLAGMGAGLAAAGIVSLFTRGADVNIPSGTQIEMVLQRPLVLEEENLSNSSGQASALVPSSVQPKPLPRPIGERMLCPVGTLGCGI